MSQDRKLHWSIERDNHGTHTELIIKVYAAMPFWGNNECVAFKWNARATDAVPSWYGFRFAIEGDSTAMLEDLVWAAKRVLKAAQGHEPTEILRVLDERHAVRVVYDRRESRWLPVGDVKPADCKAWRDDYKTMGFKYCKVGALAREQEEARKLMLAQLYENRDMEFIAQWAAAGMPVIQLSGQDYEAPVVAEVDDLLNASKYIL